MDVTGLFEVEKISSKRLILLEFVVFWVGVEFVFEFEEPNPNKSNCWVFLLGIGFGCGL